MLSVGENRMEVGKRTAADWPLEWKCVAPRCDCRCSRVASRWRARPLVGEQAMFGRRRRWERWTWSRRRAGIRQSRCPRELHQPLSGPRGDPYARVLRSAIEIPMWVRGPSEICRWVEFRCATRFRSRKRPREPPGFLGRERAGPVRRPGGGRRSRGGPHGAVRAKTRIRRSDPVGPREQVNAPKHRARHTAHRARRLHRDRLQSAARFKRAHSPVEDAPGLGRPARARLGLPVRRDVVAQTDRGCGGNRAFPGVSPQADVHFGVSSTRRAHAALKDRASRLVTGCALS